MVNKKLITIGMIVGSIAGGYVPSLWGAGGLTFTSLLFSSIGAIAGVIIVHKYL